MTLKQNFTDQLKAQSEIWQAQTKDYQERPEQASEQARAEYKKAVEKMQTTVEEASSQKRRVARTRRLGRIWSRQIKRRSRSYNEVGRTRFPVSSDRAIRPRLYFAVAQALPQAGRR